MYVHILWDNVVTRRLRAELPMRKAEIRTWRAQIAEDDANILARKKLSLHCGKAGVVRFTVKSIEHGREIVVAEIGLTAR